MIRRTPRSTRTDTLFPTRRSSDLPAPSRFWSNSVSMPCNASPKFLIVASPLSKNDALRISPRLEPSVSSVAHDTIDTSSLSSEEHTSELQSLMRISYSVVYLKKKINQTKLAFHPTPTNNTSPKYMPQLFNNK